MAELCEVHFEPSGRTAWVATGTTIVAAGELAGVEIVTGCTEGMCGTDPVRVVAGADALSPPAEHERGTLDRMGLGADHRLACSARISGPGRVEIRTDTDTL